MGWLSEIGSAEFEVIWQPPALTAAEAAEAEFNIDLRSHAERILSQDPLPHPYKRIKRNADGSFTLAMKYWRIEYRIDNDTVMIDSIRSELPDPVSV
jgi:hypothetical protein